jgi:glycosyltransferase involved in cell wall biosynthesis
VNGFATRTAVVAAIVPARDEGARIQATVRALRALEVIDEIVVVDDASGDATASIAAEAGARAFRLARRAGKGGALAFGLSRTLARTIVLVDGDLGGSAGVAGALLTPVLAGEADMAILNLLAAVTFGEFRCHP